MQLPKNGNIVLQLRADGKTWKEIGEVFAKSGTWACQLYFDSQRRLAMCEPVNGSPGVGVLNVTKGTCLALRRGKIHSISDLLELDYENLFERVGAWHIKHVLEAMREYGHSDWVAKIIQDRSSEKRGG